MSVMKRLGAATVVLLAALAAVLAFGGGASASTYPLGSSPTLSAGSSSGVAGDDVTVNGDGFSANSTASLSFHSTPVDLGTVAVSAAGSFSVTVKIPSDATAGVHHIEAVDGVTGKVATTTFTITSGSGTGTGTGTGTGSADTGVAVVGIGAIGAVLLVGGGLMLMAGRRRKVTV